jgi:HNH endonuclease
MDAATRRLVQTRAGFRCEYCQIHEDEEPYTFHLEHVVPKKHLGEDDRDNLAWSCQNCNLFKGANLSGLEQEEVVSLFHPRKQNWNRHFRWKGPILVGKTKCGRATIHVLKINAKDRVDLRKLLIELGVFPP